MKANAYLLVARCHEQCDQIGRMFAIETFVILHHKVVQLHDIFVTAIFEKQIEGSGDCRYLRVKVDVFLQIK